MPYKIQGKNILHKKGGKWSIKQRCKNHANAVKALGLLEGLESGSIKPSQVGKGKYAKKKKKIAKKRTKKKAKRKKKYSAQVRRAMGSWA